MSESHVSGLRELSRKLNQLGSDLAAKTLRQSLMNAATPIVKDAKLRIPVGDVPHRSYKGNLLTPGFARRSIRKTSRIESGRAVVRIGVRREAFYAVQFLELGTEKMKPKAWLVPAMKAQRLAAEQRLKEQLKRKIRKATQ